MGALASTGTVASARLPAFVSAPVLRWKGSVLTVHYVGESWSLDRSAFGSGASLRVSRQREGYLVRLRGATLPGTSLLANFDLRLVQEGRGWQAKLNLPGLRFSAEADLRAWLRGKPLSRPLRTLKFEAGAGQLRTGAGTIAVSSTGGLTLALASEIRLAGQCQCRAKGLILEVARRSGDFGPLADDPGGWATRFELLKPVLSRRAFACGDHSTLAAVRTVAADRVGGEFFAGRSGKSQETVIEGPARLEMRTGAEAGTQLRFDRAVVAVGRRCLGVAGTVSSDAFAAPGAGFVATCRGNSQVPFCATFKPGEAPHFSAAVLSTGLWLGAEGADAARLAFPDREITLATAPVAEGTFDRIVVGTQPTIIGPLVESGLDGAELWLRSGSNLLDLRFRFEGFRIRWHGLGAPDLLRDSEDGFYVKGRMWVELPPQHLSETILDLGESQDPCPQTGDSVGRLSASSWIVFEFPRQPIGHAIWKKTSLRVDELTNWAGLTMVVDPRASSAVRDDDLKSQLDVVNIETDTTLADAIDNIQKTIRAPGPDATSLELAEALIFSPAENAVWERSELGSDRSVPIFGVRIGHGNDARLRALWSRLLGDGIPSNEKLLPETDGPLSRRHHWEIIGQTSAYGLPALRRLIKDDPNPPRTDPDAALTRVPRGGVIRPEEDYEYLAEVDRYIAATASPPLPLGPETGIALATAFDTADVTLTSLGATMRLDWRGEPAILKSTNAVPLPDSFSLERLFYQAWLGRDVRVIAVDKGYLLPFGVRASYLTVSERVFLPGVRGPVAKEIQRRFITVARAPKRFPAVNQPDGGRDFPASLLTMLTTRTPDLVKPVDEATGRIVVDHPGAGPDWAFWPRFRAQSGLMDVEWKSLVDEDNTPLVNNMIFILNAAAANQDFVAKVVRYYNGALRESDPGRRDTWPPRNVAKLGGARRSYAPRADTARPMRGRSQADTPAPPDTAFDTESWLLVVRGRSSGSGDPTGKDDNFVMDARMNGADQPPFYPSLRRAAIGVQSIDRLVGKPQGLIETQPYRPYVTGGFDAGNKGEIYLEVMWPLISLNPAAAERPAAGGVAQPDTKVAAFSRVSGIVGGTEGKQKAVPGVVRALVEQPRLYFSKAAEGKFNPEEFFKLKVFGLDLLKGIEVDLDLGNAPRLSELVDYGASQVRQDQIQEAARRARTVVVNARAAIDRGIVQFNDDIDDVAPGVTFATLYPELMKAYGDATDTLIAELDVVANQGDLQIVATAAMKISAAAKPLMIEISRVTRDPLPPAVNTAIAEIIGEWRKFEGLIRNLPATIEAELRAFVNAQVAELDRLSADYLALLFGLQGGETILDLVRNPDARARLGETLFYEQFGERILQMLHAVERFVIELGGAAAIARERVREAAEAAIHAELQALAGQLSDDLVMTASNILREQDVERLAVALADAVDQTVRTLTAAPDLTQALVRLQQVKAELGGGAARQQIDQAIKAQIEARKAWIVAVDPAEQARLYALFAAAVAAAALNEAVLVATEAVDRVITAVDARLHSGFDAFVAIALDALNATLDGATALHDLARVAELGRTTINGWCTDAAGGVLRTVKALGNGVLALKADIDAAITGVASAVSAIQPPGTVSAPILARFEAIRSALLRSVQVAADASAELDAAREALKTMSGAATCAATADFAQALGKAIAERSESVAALRGMTVQISALQRLIREAPGHNDDFKNAVEPHLARMVHDARVLIGGLSVVGKVDLAGIWHDEIAAAKDKVRQAIGLSGFQTRLDESYSRLVREGTAIRNALVSASAEELAGLVESTVALAEWDRRFAGLIVETVALGDGARAKVEAVALAMLNGAARHLLTLHVEAYGPLVQLRDHIAGYPTVIYLLGTEYANFVTAVSDVDRDIKLLRDLAGAPDFPKAVISLKALKDQWDGKTLALTRAVRAIASFIDAFLKGQLGRLLAERVREQFALLERTLREMIAEFVPARITTRYDWNTTIGDVSGGFFNFAMRPPRSDKDLEIKSIIEFNFLSGRRNAIIEGTLKPFKVQLPGLFTLFFREATFKSENGSDPAFKVDLEDIALEKSLQFLESLRSIFAPSGNGFYIQPSLRRLKVGYGFARDYATVGSLTLSNIALDIYVELPFGKDPVCFGFLFASKEKPFLISNPPYGGGGWVRILFETNKKPDIALSFMFGAVTDIQFGPLRGQGRICAGIWWENDELTAFVEAVGEGSIACFSISILIGIYLTYRPSDGAMYGKARYEFKFKVGFVTFKYKVEAAYRIRGSQQGAGGSGSGGGFAAAAAAVALMPAQALLAAVGLDGPGTHVHTTKVPPKSFKWRDYSAYVALELLDD